MAICALGKVLAHQVDGLKMSVGGRSRSRQSFQRLSFCTKQYLQRLECLGQFVPPALQLDCRDASKNLNHEDKRLFQTILMQREKVAAVLLVLGFGIGWAIEWNQLFLGFFLASCAYFGYVFFVKRDMSSRSRELK